MTTPSWDTPTTDARAGDLAGPAPVDPYLLWALHTRYAGSAPRGNNMLALLVEVDRDRMAVGDARQRYMSIGGTTADDETTFYSVHVAREKLAELVALAREGAIVRFQLCVPRLWEQGIRLPHLLPIPQVEGAHTLGVIDDGCCIAHRALRTGSSSRLLYVWDQGNATVEAQEGERVSGPTTWGVVVGSGLTVWYGSEMTRQTIEEALSDWQSKREDERAFYRKIGRPAWGQRGRTHGAGVLHIFCGHGGARPVTPPAGATALPSATAPIIFVQLPCLTVADASGGSLGWHVLEAARYIVARTRESVVPGGDWKTTINISLGGIAGPHDGTSMTEQALDELVARHEGRVKLIVAAGNAADRRIHARGVASPGHPCTFRVLVPPAQGDESFVEFWLPTGIEQHMRFDVQAPRVDAVTVPLGSAAMLRDEGNRVIACLAFAAKVAQGRNRTMALLAVGGTAADRDGAAAPYGVWTITVHNDAPTGAGDRDARIEAWVERHEVIIGRRGGQRARFVAGPASDAVVLDDASTLSSIANGTGTVIVGGYTRSTRRGTRDSSRGPVLGREGEITPDYMAPSSDGTWLRGVRVPGFYSGQTTRMSGTSAAAPRVARMIADDSVSAQVFVDVLGADAPGVE